MEEKPENKYVMRSVKDYSSSFKLQAVKEIEWGYLSFTEAQRSMAIRVMLLHYGGCENMVPLTGKAKLFPASWVKILSKVKSNIPSSAPELILATRQL